MKRFQIAAATVLIIGGISYLVFTAATGEGMVYKTIADLRAGRYDDRVVRLAGKVKEGTIERAPAERRVSFVVVDEDSAAILTHFTGTAPDTLRDKGEVVVSGRYDAAADVFLASELLAKCPSKYEGRYDTAPSAS